jgi:hypothetical protein
MGYVYCHSACFGCGRIFSYNPKWVPSIPVDGEREPVCRACVERVNVMRKSKGLDPIMVASSAYQPIDEQELL